MFLVNWMQSELYLQNPTVLEHVKETAQYIESESLHELPMIIESESFEPGVCCFLSFLYGLILLGLLQIKLKRKYTMHVVYIAIFVQYQLRVMLNEISYRDDAVLAGGVFKNSSSFLGFLWTYYQVCVQRAACWLFRQLQIYGKLRVCVYILSVILSACLLVHTADLNMKSILNFVSKEVTVRMNDSIIEVEENRDKFGEVMLHPITKGEKNPFLMHQFFRYHLEDVRMECQFRALWLSGSSSVKHQVVWRRNGLNFPLTDRHNQQISVREEQGIDSALRKAGFSWYNVNATLDIYLLQASDFGNYTCDIVRCMNIEDGREDKSNRKQTFDFQDELDQIVEFRLIKMTERQEIIRAPVSSILRFTTSYWHLARKEDVEIDYSVNDQSFNNLCPDRIFNGCSKFLLLYWYFGLNLGERFGVPPLYLSTVWEIINCPADRYTLIQCLCQNAYGYHNVKYLRRYYNTTTKQKELIEILHPHTLVIIPREQEMLHLFKNRSRSLRTTDREVCEKPSSACRSGEDFQTIKDFAQLAVKHFEEDENVTTVLLVFTAAIALLIVYWLLTFLGRCLGRLTLEGSMEFLSTAQIPAGTQQQISQADGDQQAKEVEHYDVFLSYSEADAEINVVHYDVLTHLEAEGFKACVRERDIPPNVLEVQGLSTAILNSDKFIFLVSTSYLEDVSCRDFEAPMIIDVATRRPQGASQILVIKLDHCELPEWLSIFEVHDLSDVSPQDYLLRLLMWLKPPECKCTVRDKLGVLLAFPQLIMGAVRSVALFYT